MSSLFKHSFNGKQLKQFTELTLKALPNISKETIKPIYKSIKNGTNSTFKKYDIAINALEKKIKLNIQIAIYKKIINDKKTNTLRQLQSSKQHLVKLTMSKETTQLLQQIESGFNLQQGSLTPSVINDVHLNPSKPKRSRSVSKNNGLILDQIEQSESKSSTKSSINDTKSPQSQSSTVLHSLSTDNSHTFNKQRSKSVVNISTKTSPKIKYSPTVKCSPKLKAVPEMNTKEYLQFLLERAVTNKTFNDNDADRLCKCAITMKCEWITVHSMWVKLCYKLLEKYTIKQYKTDLQNHKKSNRRGSKIIFKSETKNFNLLINSKVKNIKSNTKICVTIGYPLGQTSTVSKVAETTQSVNDGATRIRLMISAGKVVVEDWDYIINEVRSVVSAAAGADVRIVFPDTSQITNDIKHRFNQRIMQGMAMGMSPSPSPVPPVSPLPSHVNGINDFDDDNDENKSIKSIKINCDKKRKNNKDKTRDKEDSESSDGESSESNISFDNNNNNNMDVPKQRGLSRSDEGEKINKSKIIKHLTISNNKNKDRRASTMTSLKIPNKINQSVTQLQNEPIGALKSKKKRKKSKKKLYKKKDSKKNKKTKKKKDKTHKKKKKKDNKKKDKKLNHKKIKKREKLKQQRAKSVGRIK